MADDKPADQTTNLTVPGALRARVMDECEGDRRTYKAELLVLLEEALDARDRRRK